jgi:hypothetical protein
VETSETLVSVDEMMRIFLTTPGVIKAEVLAAG